MSSGFWEAPTFFDVILTFALLIIHWVLVEQKTFLSLFWVLQCPAFWISIIGRIIISERKHFLVSSCSHINGPLLFLPHFPDATFLTFSIWVLPLSKYWKAHEKLEWWEQETLECVHFVARRANVKSSSLLYREKVAEFWQK